MTLVLVACTKTVITGPVTPAAPASPSQAPSPTSASASEDPGHPPKPSLRDTRLEGTFSGPSVTIASNVDYGKTNPSSRVQWSFKPVCKEGVCDVILNSTRNYKVRLALVGAFYEGQIRRNNQYTCGRVNNDANEQIHITPIRSKLMNGEWVVTKLKGTLTYTQISHNGLCTPADEKFAVTLKRATYAGD
jgi:hypothetical protein